jgi:hypothetical protein
MDAKMVNENFSLYLRVLGYQEDDGSWAAHCLETDLVGYGANFEAALANLQELTAMQVSFAFYKNQPALLDRPAPTEIFELYNLLLRETLQHFTVKDRIDKSHKITSIPWPDDISTSDFAIATM